MRSRRSIRLVDRDYSAAGAYFVTICTSSRRPELGTRRGGQMLLTLAGQTAIRTWYWLPTQYAYVSLDAWCVMPDHLHGILVLRADDVSMKRKTIGSLVGAFKTRSTAEINRLRGTAGAQFWQRDFWDHVILDQPDLERVRVYIRDNIAAGAWHPTV